MVKYITCNLKILKDDNICIEFDVHSSILISQGSRYPNPPRPCKVSYDLPARRSLRIFSEEDIDTLDDATARQSADWPSLSRLWISHPFLMRYSVVRSRPSPVEINNAVFPVESCSSSTAPTKIIIIKMLKIINFSSTVLFFSYST